MYHAEKIINGILHYRSTPNGKWIAYTIEQLTDMMTRHQSGIETLKYLGDLS